MIGFAAGLVMLLNISGCNAIRHPIYNGQINNKNINFYRYVIPGLLFSDTNHIMEIELANGIEYKVIDENNDRRISRDGKDRVYITKDGEIFRYDGSEPEGVIVLKQADSLYQEILKEISSTLPNWMKE